MTAGSTGSTGVPRPPVPFTVIGGFLGAGKTTLLNHVLRHTTERIAVVVNDFGTITIDADLVASHDGDTIALANGCVCCSIAGDLALTLIGLRRADPPFDRVITEASGVSDPRKIAQYGTTPGFRLDGVIVLADAGTLDATLRDERIAGQVGTQLERADLIILNKVDVATGEQISTATELLAQRCPSIPVLAAAQAEVPLPVLFDIDPVHHERPGLDDDHGDHGFESLTIATDLPVGRARLTEIAEALPSGVLRAKGIVQDSAGAQWVLHRVGAIVKVTALPAASSYTSASIGRIVLIAPSGVLDGYQPPEPFRAARVDR